MMANSVSHFDSSISWPNFILKYMEQKTDFIVHLEMPYLLIMPFLRGLYLKMKSLSPGQDRDGWKISKRVYDAYINYGLGAGSANFSSRSYKE